MLKSQILLILNSNPIIYSVFKFLMLSELHNLNLKFCRKQYYNSNLLCQIVAPQLSGGWLHNVSTKTWQVGHANEQSFYSVLSMDNTYANTKAREPSLKGKTQYS
jgi:hypothetical protein